VTSLCECPICGGWLQGRLSDKHFIRDEVFCDSCDFTEPLTEVVERADDNRSGDNDRPSSQKPYLN
jgi:hypothetical protein